MSRLQIDTITINDFQGFPPNQAVPPIKLGGKNLLLYGENGSGKSTIFTALAELLNRHPTRAFDSHTEEASCLKHRFSDKGLSEGKVSLAFTVGDPMEWLISRLRAEHEEHEYFDSMSRSSGFLDYRAILRTHFLDYQNESINLFSLVVGTLLRDVEMPTETATFGMEWKTILNMRGAWLELLDLDADRIDDEEYFTPLDMDRIGFDPSLYLVEIDEEDTEADDVGEAQSETFPLRAATRFRHFVEIQREQIEEHIERFAERLRQRLSEIVTLANQFLSNFRSRFEPILEISFDRNAPYIPADEETLRRVDWESKVTLPLRAVFRGEVINHPGTLLNEARLTAIALTFYLAAIKVQTPDAAPITAPRLLVLDDVLIGLDMAHRRPVLELLLQEFPRDRGWQVMLFTYDRAWYEVARQELPDTWKRYEMFAVGVGDYEMPLLVSDNDSLLRAVEFLERGEIKAAAVHVRSKFETVVKNACADLHLLIPYSPNPSKTATSEFWSAVKALSYQCQGAVKITPADSKGVKREIPKAPIQYKVVEPKLADRIDGAISWVLNPLSHSEPVDRYRREIEDAIYAIEELQCQIKNAHQFRDKPSPHQYLTKTLQAISESKEAQERTSSTMNLTAS